MAYGKKRYYKRKFKRRGMGTFSRYKTYKNRSSKAQAYQIYRLNKKVNTIQKRTKPEIKIENADNNYYNSGAISVTGYRQQIKMIAPFSGTPYKGRLVRLQNVKVWGNLEYMGDAEFAKPIQVRMIFYQSKGKGVDHDGANNVMFDPATFFRNTATNLEEYNGPLSPGITSNIKIVKDKRVVLNSNTVLKKNFRFNLKHLYYLRTDKDIEEIQITDYTHYHGWLGCYIFVLNDNSAPSIHKVVLNMYWQAAYYDD